jgi:hypothetical protein
MKKEKAIALLREERGLQFDAALVDCFARLAQTAGLDWIIGHSDESRPLLHCPVCGPIVAVPGGKQDGDAIYCHACKGKFELHIKGDTFDLEFKNERDLSVRPEIDLQQIGKIGDILGSGL